MRPILGIAMTLILAQMRLCYPSAYPRTILRLVSQQRHLSQLEDPTSVTKTTDLNRLTVIRRLCQPQLDRSMETEPQKPMPERADLRPINSKTTQIIPIVVLQSLVMEQVAEHRCGHHMRQLQHPDPYNRCLRDILEY